MKIEGEVIFFGAIGGSPNRGTASYEHESKSIATFSGMRLCDLYFGSTIIVAGGLLGFGLYLLALAQAAAAFWCFLAMQREG
jgi:hypothetical protein